MAKFKEAPISDFQRWLLQVPQVWHGGEPLNMALLGGRGGGKNWGLAFLILKHLQEYKENARILFLRKTYASLRDFEDILRFVLNAAYGSAARYNSQEHLWHLPHGHLELGQLETDGDYEKYQGRSFTLLVLDEVGQFASPRLIDKLQSNLRAQKGIPCRTIIAANPGGEGSSWIAKRHALLRKHGVPYFEEDTESWWVMAHSTYRDNPFIDHEDYVRKLRTACANDPELLEAWLTGDWSVQRGAYFGAVLSEKRNKIDPWPQPKQGRFIQFEWMIGLDFGTSAPSVCYVAAKSQGAIGPDERHYPKGSIILVDEFSSDIPGDLTIGFPYTVSELAEEIKALCKPWKIPPRGAADDQIIAKDGRPEGSIAGEFAKHGVQFFKAGKGDRISGWELMRQLLADAGKPDVPGLYVTRNCRYWWETVPFLQRDTLKPADVDRRSKIDHGADCSRYLCVYRVPRVTRQPLPFGY